MYSHMAIFYFYKKNIKTMNGSLIYSRVASLLDIYKKKNQTNKFLFSHCHIKHPSRGGLKAEPSRL